MNKRETLKTSSSALPIPASVPHERLVIPRRYVHGRNTPQEYRAKSTREVDAYFTQDGAWDSLVRYPIEICMLAMPNGLLPVIMNGHHRARRSGKFGIHELPTRSYRLEDVAKAWQEDPEELHERYYRQVTLATLEFDRRTEHYVSPQMIPFCDSLEQLAQLAQAAPETTAVATLYSFGITTY
jgi:hypothetical protein